MKVIVYNKSMSDFYFQKTKEVVTLHCKALDEAGFVRHCFTTRHGGVSQGYLGTMNLSFSREDRAAVSENYRRLCQAEGFCLPRFTLTKQVHQTDVLPVEETRAGMGMTKQSDFAAADGLITDLPETPLAAFTADCGGILLADPVKKAVAAVHSGWRGTLAGIGAKAVHSMTERYGTDPKNVIAAIGPCIGPCCFEVGRDVYDAFTDRWGEQNLFTPKGEKYLLNLWRALELVLLNAGVQAQNIHCAEICTMCHADEFYSHRATAGKRGNMAAVIEIRRDV